MEVGRALEATTDTANLYAFTHVNMREPKKLVTLCQDEAAQGNVSALSNLAWYRVLRCVSSAQI